MRLGGGNEERLEAILDGAVGDGHRQVRLAATGLSEQHEAATLGDEVR
ncbi:MAG: hypothetical protein MUF80_09030 [Burkholderiales bacterium]|jgi:hypothetical protein|nr:hypothetical protein [Burkholderiales bacterium]